MEEFVILTVAELKLEMTKEVEKIEKNYSVLHGKVDVVVEATTNLVEYIIPHIQPSLTQRQNIIQSI